MSEISVAGCGRMGSALIRALAHSGARLTIWNRTTEKAAGLAQAGVTVADSFGEAFEASPSIILVLSHYEVCRRLLDQERGRLRGRTIVQLTTGKPAEARRLAEFAVDHGASYLDGAIMGYPNQVATPALQVFYSGDPSAFAAQKPRLERLGGALFVGEDAGAASALDIAFLTPLITMVVGLLHGLRMCRQENLGFEQYAGLVRTGLPAIIVDTIEKSRQPDFAANPEKIECTVELMAGVAGLIAEYCNDVDIDDGLFGALAGLFEGGIKAGRGHHDWMCSADLHAYERS